jgi:hypothetical protein
MHCMISYVELVVIVELAATCRGHVARRDVGSEGPSCNAYPSDHLTRRRLPSTDGR